MKDDDHRKENHAEPRSRGGKFLILVTEISAALREIFVVSIQSPKKCDVLPARQSLSPFAPRKLRIFRGVKRDYADKVTLGERRAAHYSRSDAN